MIGFDLTEEQRKMQEIAQKFAEKEIKPIAKTIDKNPENPFPRDVMNRLAEKGFFNMLVPEEYGGDGLESLTIEIISEELAVGDAGITVSLLESLGVIKPIIFFGSEGKKKRFLPSLVSKKEARLCALAITEPGAGSNIAGFSTPAKLEGDHYVINGTKCFIINGC